MKIGILTYHHLPNYGAALQAYALCSFLRKLGYEAEIIDYRNYGAELRVYKDLIKSILSFDYKKYMLKAKKKNAFENFLSFPDLLSSKKTYFSSNCALLMKNYDCLICGSDEIWNLSNYRGYEPVYFLKANFKQPVKRIAYAVSCGYCNTFGNFAEEIKNALKSFNKIMVRDSKTAQMILEETDIESEQVMDPVFLWDFEEVIDLSEIHPKPYVLLTGQLNEHQIDYGLSLAKKKNWNVVGAGYFYQNVKNCRFDIGPIEWVNLIKNSDLVVSSLFHATAFAIKFKRDFLVFSSKSKQDKISGLLSPLNLENRILKNDLIWPSDIPEISSKAWDKVMNEIDLKSKISSNLLSQAVKETSKE